MLAADAPEHEPDRQHCHRHEQRGGDRYIDRHAFVAQAFEQIAEQPDHIITDGGDRQSFDGRLQAQLQPRAVVHGLEQVAVLPFHFDVHPRAQEIGGAGELCRQVGLPLLGGGAGAHRWRHAPRQERRPGRQRTGLALADRGQAQLHDFVIGAAGAEAEQAGRGAGFQLGRQRGQFVEQAVVVDQFVGAPHFVGDFGEPRLDACDRRHQPLRFRQAEQRQGAIGLPFDDALHQRAGALVRRIAELETYRTLALLGLPEAQRLMPSIARIEARLAEVTDEMRRTDKLIDNHRLLDELTALAAELEAGAAASLFRFGASRAYNEIVQLRLQTIGERKVGGLPTWSSFLARRMAPAMRTCITTEERQTTLSEKLALAANLLRTRVDVELERQNRDLLKSMNERTRLQLRLQTTVEGLSVAAVSYYVVGLFGYLVKGLHDEGVPVDISLATALFVPVAVLAIWLVVRRIRRKHIAGGG